MASRKLPLVSSLPARESPSSCGVCAGACCKNLPGTTAPQEWGRTRQEIFENVVKALRSKRWTIDWWEGDPRDVRGQSRTPGALTQTYYVRPAIKKREGEVFHAGGGWGANATGDCSFLGPRGCELPSGRRPVECRALIAGPYNEKEKYHECKGDARYGKKMNAMRWIPYQDLLYKAGNLVDSE